MKIAFVGQKGIPSKFGGVEKHVEELGIRLAHKGYNIITYTRRNYSNFKGMYKGIRVLSLPAISQKHTEMISHTFFSLLSLLDKKVDVIHIHSVDPAILSFIPRLNSKVVVTSHGQAYRREKWGPIAKSFSKLAERAFTVFPDKRIAVSKTLKKYYEEKYNCDVIYIPNGVNVKAVSSTSAITKLGLSKNEYLLFVGRIIPTKGCETLIKAFSKIKTSKKLVFAGGSSYSDTYFTDLKRKANSRTMFLGYRYGDELAQLYAHAYCCVLPSEIEGLALTLLEAMSYGKCVVYSDIPENVEAAEGVGIPFFNKDIDDCADKMKCAINNPDFCQKLGVAATARVRRDYNWSKIVTRTEEVYRSLIN
ncbi:MAG: glycosyltransferase family 4 protein [bacterium]